MYEESTLKRRRKRYRPETRAIAKRAAAIRGVRAWGQGTKRVDQVMRLLRRMTRTTGQHLTPEFVLELAGTTDDTERLQAIAQGREEPTPELYRLAAKMPRNGLKEPWLAAVLLAIAEHLQENPPSTTLARTPQPIDIEELKALVVEYVNTHQAAPPEAPLLGAPFIQGGRVFMQLEGRGGVGRDNTVSTRTGLRPFLRDDKDSPMAEFKRPIQVALTELGFVRAPFAYAHPERGFTSASYYSLPVEDLGVEEGPAPAVKEPKRGRRRAKESQ